MRTKISPKLLPHPRRVGSLEGEAFLMDKIAASLSRVLGDAILESTAVAHLLPDGVLNALNAWIADQPDAKPSRAEAIRQILAEHLKVKGYLK